MTFNDIFIDSTKKGRKILKENYHSKGKIPIIDQGKNQISGFSDEKMGIYKEIPVIIFGDHTRIIKYVDYPFLLGADGVKILSIKTNKFIAKYLYYALLNYYIPDTGYNRHFKWLKNFTLNVNSIDEQKRIVIILDKIVTMIDKKKKQINLLEELVKSRFIEMFGDPIRNEKGWKVKKWEEVLKIINGKNQKKVENQSGKYDIFGSGGKMGKADDWLVKENSVLIGRKGSINKPIIVKEKIWNVDTVFGLEPNIEIINCDYLYYFCYFYDFERLNKAVTIPSLTKKDLLKIDIPIPPLVLQEKFVLIHKSINKLKFEAEKSLKEMENLYESLMQKFFKQ